MHVRRIFALAFSLVICCLFALSPGHTQISIGISVDVEPPPLPVYDQPPIPAPGYLWVPGYWAWDDDTGYYWVPGTWVTPPEPELLWTPGYWGWDDGAYQFHDGYWGPQIGFYGGVAYGFGYTGDGYEGGYWRNGNFFYNQSVNNISNVSITNVYSKTVVVNNTTNVSYNGGTGGTAAKPTAEQVAAGREHHVAADARANAPRGSGGERSGAVAQQQSRPPYRCGDRTSRIVYGTGDHSGAPGQADCRCDAGRSSEGCSKQSGSPSGQQGRPRQRGDRSRQ